MCVAHVETLAIVGPTGPELSSLGRLSTMTLRPRWMTRSLSQLIVSVVCVSGFILAVGFGTAAPADAGTTEGSSTAHIAGWTMVTSSVQNTLVAGEGVATVAEPGHSPYELYRGLESVPDTLKTQGWTHIGDPDSIRGYIFDAYQGPSSGNSKMFLVTTPSGQTFEYVHTLVKGEIYNNSFDAVSPDSQWMVAGEWGTMSHLQIYPTPILDRRVRTGGGPLRLAGYIKLDHKVNDIQGCDFVTAVRMICVSDDDSETLFKNEKPLLEVDLPHSLHGNTVTGHVVDLGPIPQESSCSGTFEAEGIDFDVNTDTLRVEIIQPGSCILKTTVYQYKPTGGNRHR